MPRHSPLSFYSRIKNESPIPEYRSKSVLNREVNSKIFKLNKALYNVRSPSNKISLLEKLALRGEGSLNEGKFIQTHRKALSMNDQLNGHHNLINEGKQIINLPKLPFGKHNHYNEVEKFSKHHFYVPNKVPPSRAKDVDDYTRKLRILIKKGKTTRLREKTVHETPNSTLTDYNVYETRAGLLMCQKEKEIIKSYETEKNKWTAHLRLLQPFGSKDEEEAWKKKVKERIEKSRKLKFKGDLDVFECESDSEDVHFNKEKILRHLLVIESDI
ncbi:unnamed protein product [Blepharisma stoltei]|uniref:Uncharacterized protein n=1 Tax=Blepharisma stoltei TaxID=1481888 RepID=A0AAU9K534_9CILI|nr:unnamed protein product [Blepharisma stoltei]